MSKHCCLKGDTQDLIELYDFIGIHEFFSSDYFSLTSLLGKPKIQPWKENASKHPNYQNDLKKILDNKMLISKMAFLNKKDMELYKLALELRSQRKGFSLTKLINSSNFSV